MPYPSGVCSRVPTGPGKPAKNESIAGKPGIIIKFVKYWKNDVKPGKDGQATNTWPFASCLTYWIPEIG